jgi:hypothetical protein
VHVTESLQLQQISLFYGSMKARQNSVSPRQQLAVCGLLCKMHAGFVGKIPPRFKLTLITSN